jgi:hypothetical protein
VGDTDLACQGLFSELPLQIEEFAFGAAAFHETIMNRGDAGRIITPIFKPSQGIDQPFSDRRRSNDANDTAHVNLFRFPRLRAVLSHRTQCATGAVVNFNLLR